MKIEKINDNQIRCTLTREDLDSRHINLRELAYGSEKAKLLFQDMMQEAFREYGFSAENSPLMIEAIPLSGETIVLIITKVDNPEELDSRFARFSREDDTEEGSPESLSNTLSSLDDILNLISKLTSGSRSQEPAGKKPAGTGIRPLSDDEAVPASSPVRKEVSQKNAEPVPEEDAKKKLYQLGRFFLFRDLETVIRASSVTDPSYIGWNTLFKNPDDGNYYLILRMEDTPPEQFNRVCNVLTEYGIAVDYTSGMEEFFTEHMITISAGNALQLLRELQTAG